MPGYVLENCCITAWFDAPSTPTISFFQSCSRRRWPLCNYVPSLTAHDPKKWGLENLNEKSLFIGMQSSDVFGAIVILIMPSNTL